jgi:hypothetical protein
MLVGFYRLKKEPEKKEKKNKKTNGRINVR